MVNDFLSNCPAQNNAKRLSRLADPTLRQATVTQATQLPPVGTLEERVNPVYFGSEGGLDELASAPKAIAAGDIFGKGYNDIAMGVPQDGVVLFENNGSGSFTGISNISAFSDIRSIQLSDLTGNNINDLVVAEGDADVVGIAMGNGNGTFQPVENVQGVSAVEDAAVGNLVPGGLPDLAFIANGELEVYLNNGTNTPFTAATKTIYTGMSGGVYGLGIGDFTGNGLEDIAVSGVSATSVLSS